MQLCPSGAGTHVPLSVHVERISSLGENPTLHWNVTVAPTIVLLTAPIKMPEAGDTGGPQSTGSANKNKELAYKFNIKFGHIK